MGICSKITFQHTSALCRTSGSLQIFRVVQTPPTNILSQRAPQWPNPFQWLCFTKAHAGAEETCIKNSGVAVLLWEWRVEKTKHSEREKLKHLLSGIVLTRSWRGLDLVLSCYILANSRGSSYGHSCFQFIFKSQVPASSQDLPRTHTHTDSLSLSASRWAWPSEEHCAENLRELLAPPGQSSECRWSQDVLVAWSLCTEKAFRTNKWKPKTIQPQDTTANPNPITSLIILSELRNHAAVCRMPNSSTLLPCTCQYVTSISKALLESPLPPPWVPSDQSPICEGLATNQELTKLLFILKII